MTIDRTMTLDGDEIVGVVVVADQPNVNGITYTRESVLSMMKSSRMVFIHPSVGNDNEPQLRMIGANITEMVLRDDGALAVRATLFDNDFGNMLRRRAQMKEYGFSLCARGTLDADNLVHDAVFEHITVALLKDLS